LSKKNLQSFKEDEQKRIKQNRKIKLSSKQSCRLFFSKLCCNWCCLNKKLEHLYTKGAERLQKEFDLAKIIVKLRNINVFVKHKLIDEVSQVEINNCFKSVIDLDSEPEQEVQNAVPFDTDSIVTPV
jgi:hypothetical protein